MNRFKILLVILLSVITISSVAVGIYIGIDLQQEETPPPVVDNDQNNEPISPEPDNNKTPSQTRVTLELESREDIYLLKDGSNEISFYATYLSDYTITINTTETVYLKVNNSEVTGNNNTFSTRLFENSSNTFEIYGNTNELSGTISISPSINLTDISIPADSTYLIAYDVSSIVCKNIAVSNNDAIIQGVKTFNGSTFDAYIFDNRYIYSSNSISTPLTSGRKYFLIKNQGAQTITSNLNVTDVETLTAGVNSNQAITTNNNFVFKKFVASTLGIYVFTFDFDDSTMGACLYDNSFARVNTTMSNMSLFSPVINGTYWICYRIQGSSSTGSIAVNPSSSSISWKVDGEPVLNGVVQLEVGGSYEFECMINGMERLPIRLSYEVPGVEIRDNYILTINIEAPIATNAIEVCPFGVIDTSTGNFTVLVTIMEVSS